jgi:F-type H+-transporting ATPase subunit epsilon
MAEKIHLSVITPERVVLDMDVDRVEVPGLDGEIGILPGHTELISQLKPAGLLTYHVGEDKGEISISDGFVEVSRDRVEVLADRAERPEDIDLAHALEIKEKAERQIQKAMTDPDIDIARATADLERSMIDLQLAEKAKRG